MHHVADAHERGPAANRPLIDPWRAEFADPALELEFHLRHLDATARRLRSTGLIGAVGCLVFSLSDYVRFGPGRVFAGLLAFRLLIVVLTVVRAEAVRRKPVRALQWTVITALEAAVTTVCLVVVFVDSGAVVVNDLGLSATIIGVLLLVPNRFRNAFILSAVTVVIDVVHDLVVGAGSPSTTIPAVLTLVSFLLVGSLSANQLNRARRVEYLWLRSAQSSNERLVDEIDRRQVLEHELTWLATHDPLTDLLNRRAFYALAEQEALVARRSATPVTLLVIDADEFKRINDVHGHRVGDEALRSMASTCRSHLRADDVAGRIGGEEFAVVMPRTTQDEAYLVAEDLREAIASVPLDGPEGEITLSVSIGVTELRPWAETMVEGLHRADEAMYAAKSTGRNRVVPV